MHIKWSVPLVMLLLLVSSAAMAEEEEQDLSEVDTDAELEVDAEEDAEDDQVALSAEQIELHQQAVRALDADSPEASEAISLLESALVVDEESSVLYMTLGRAYQLDGECRKALDAFDMAEEVPPTAGVEEEQVLARIFNYRSQIAEQCTGELTVECRDGSTELSSDAIDQLVCDEPVEVEPGRYQIEASLEGAVTLLSVDIRGGHQEVIGVTLDAEERRLLISHAEARRRVRESMIGARQFASAIAQDRSREGDVQEEARVIAAEIVAEEVAGMGPEPEADAPRSGMVTTQIGLSPAFGGYGVQLGDGMADGGLTFGGVAHGYVGYSLAPGVGTELRLGGQFLESHSLGLKAPDGKNDETSIDMQSLVFDGEARLWIEFFSFGFFGEYRRVNLETADLDERATTMVAGPSLTFSREGVIRDDGYMSFGTRWALLGDGDLDRLSFQLEYGVGYATLGLSYGLLAESDDRLETVDGERSESLLRRGDILMMNLGFRLPLAFD